MAILGAAVKAVARGAASSTIGGFVRNAVKQVSTTGTKTQNSELSESKEATGEARSSTNDFAESVWGEMGRTLSSGAAQAQKFASASTGEMDRMARETQNGALKAQGMQEMAKAAAAGVQSIVGAMADIAGALANISKKGGGGNGADGQNTADGQSLVSNQNGSEGNEQFAMAANEAWGEHGAYS
jgi:hypothetical protein